MFQRGHRTVSYAWARKPRRDRADWRRGAETTAFKQLPELAIGTALITDRFAAPRDAASGKLAGRPLAARQLTIRAAAHAQAHVETSGRASSDIENRPDNSDAGRGARKASPCAGWLIGR